MAKPTARPTTKGAPAKPAPRARPGIADAMAGVSALLAPRPAQPATPAAMPPATGSPEAPSGGRDAHAARDLRHPVASGVAFERVENIYRMDPAKIVLEGAYVRHFIEDATFHQLVAAVAMERDIGQHLGVRVVGPPTSQRRVLIYGMRRWKAALAVGLDRVPVRDYGPISEEKAIELQMLENEIRADPHPVDTALGFYLLAQQPEWSQKRIAEVFDKNKGYVSEMVRAGEAIARLREQDRRPLYTAPRVTVRAFQALALVKSVEERREALLALLEPEPPRPMVVGATGHAVPADQAGPLAFVAIAPAAIDPARPPRVGASGHAVADAATERRRLVDEAVFHARPLRNGRSFRVRWTDDDLRRDGTRIAEEFRARMLEEYERLLHRTAVLHGTVPGQGSTVPPRIAELVASAAQETARVDARIGPAASSPAAAPEVDAAEEPVGQGSARG